MEHPTFPKINTSLDPDARGAADWVATEKVHGAQLVLATGPDGVRIGKRKAWLKDTDAFFGWQLIAPRLQEAVQTAARAVNEATVVIYGELCGGHCPHPEVAPIPAALEWIKEHTADRKGNAAMRRSRVSLGTIASC